MPSIFHPKDDTYATEETHVKIVSAREHQAASRELLGKMVPCPQWLHEELIEKCRKEKAARRNVFPSALVFTRESFDRMDAFYYKPEKKSCKRKKFLINLLFPKQGRMRKLLIKPWYALRYTMKFARGCRMAKSLQKLWKKAKTVLYLRR